MRFAYLSDGKLWVKTSVGNPREIESVFAAEHVARAQARQVNHAWKGAGRDPQSTFNARAVWGRQVGGGENVGDVAPVFRHVAAGASPGEIIYVLEMSASSGLFRQNFETGEEHRIFHRQEFLCGGLACDPSTGDIVYSAAGPSGLANIERLGVARASDHALTDGEARDTFPAYVPGAPRGTVVFQSSGAGRDGEGNLLAFGPSAVLLFSMGANDLRTLVESETHDHLAPQLDASGNLYFIRRPYQDFARPSFWAQVKNFILIPYHLGCAFFGFLDAFTRIFGRASLRHAGGPDTQSPPKRRWVRIHETAVDLHHALQRHAKGDDSASLVPATWELIRMAPDGSEETIADKIACFALRPDGALLYSNGFSVWHRPVGATTSTLIHRGKVIQALAWV
ncbi:MAG: hypothetical protein RL376_1067 [Verrucomicrobiota bacterium]|jgi:hypothetical protein